MSDKLTKWVVGNAVITIVILLVLIFGSHNKVTQNDQQNNFGSVTSLGNGISHFLALEANEYMYGTDSLNLIQTAVINTCNTASTTLFAINPYFGIATSTVTLFTLSGINGATSTDIAIGTSTAPSGSGLANGNTFATGLKENFMYLATIPTTTPFFAVAGQTLYSTQIGTTTNVFGTKVVQASSITVGPKEYLVGYSTSTWNGSANGNTSLPSIPSSCTYKAEFSI